MSKINSAIMSLRKRYEEKEDAVSAVLLSLVSGKDIVFIGPEGTGKEHLAEDACGKMSRYIISPSTDKDELSSGGTLMLEDVFRANSGTMNRIAEMMNSGNIICGSSPDVPSESDEAYSLYDRFTIRSFIIPLCSDGAFLSAVNGKNDTVVEIISNADIEKARKGAADIPVDDDVLEAILSLRDIFKDSGKYVSDSRWKDSLFVMKAAAAAADDKSVGISYIPLLQHTLCDSPEEKDEVRASVFSVCTPGSLEMNSLYAGSEELLRLAVESKGAVDESAGFPRIIYCYDCNSSFPSLKRLKDHSINKPRHTYADPHIAADSGSQDYVKYSYEGLVTLLSSKYKWDLFKKSDGSDRERFLSETKELMKRKNALDDGYENDRKRLTEGMEKNFWLTDRDRKDVLTVFNLRSAELAEVGSLIKDVEYILE
jgi:MoxR-like ATPase